MKRALTLALAGLATMTMVTGGSLAHAEDAPSPRGGAVKGAVVGGVAGHVMGGHTKTGAAVGAVAGHHEKVKSQERIDAGGKP